MYMITKFNYNKITRTLIHPVLSVSLFKKIIFDKFYARHEASCKNFFKKKDFLKYFTTGSPEELKPDFIDLKRIYDLVRKRRPKCILEFGSGFSTIAFALAAKVNEEKENFETRIFSVDSNIYWIKNSENKLSPILKKYINFQYSKTKIINYKEQIASIHENLPDISPNLIYLDGPSPEDVNGDIYNISFKSKNFYNEDNSIFYKNNGRRIVSADPLFYESSAPADFFILVDRRYCAANFLEKNLMYDYKIKKNLYFGGFVTFEKKYQPYP
jgi:hypothetical protein